jgi:hypothetical protein
MNDLMDNFARILATPMPRRKAFKLFGGAFAAAIALAAGVRTVEAAACTPAQTKSGSSTCGTGPNAKCCAAGTCCATKATVSNCCAKGQYVCPDGTCSSSNGGANKNCKKC